MRLKTLLLPITVAALALLPPLSRAQTVSLQLLSYSTDNTVTVTVNNGSSSASASDYATLQHLGATGWSPGPGPATLDLFCTELGQLAPSSPAGYTILSLSSADKAPNGTFETLAGVSASGIGALRAQNLSLLYGYEFSGGYNPTSLSTFDQATIQLAVWKLSHDDNFNHVDNLAGSYFSASNNTALIAATNSLLDAVVANAGTINAMALTVLHSDTDQDYIVPTSAYLEIPEPATYAAILGVMVMAVVMIRRRPAAA
jgi:hypothetical protein